MGNSGTVVRETERKYETDGEAALPDPAGFLDLDTTGEPERQHLDAVYFDTPDLRLLRAGVTLRRREGGHDEGWHLKLPVGPDSRDEVRLPLSGGHRQPPPQLLALTRLPTRGAAVAPVAQLSTDRRRWVLSDSRGRELAELVDDTVVAHTMGAQTAAVSWREVEVELAEHGQVELLDRIERELLRIGARRSGSGSKLGRVLADQLPRSSRRSGEGGHKGGGKKSDGNKHGNSGGKVGSAGAAVLDYLRAQAEQLRLCDPLVRRDAPEGVHQMRVAARRMRSALQTYPKVIDRAATAHLTEELKWLGGELSEARDSEVIEQRLNGVLASLPDELVLGPVAAQVTRTLQRRRSDGQRSALAALDSDRYLGLHNAIDELLADPPLTRRARRPARRELRRGMTKAWRRTTHRMRTADAAPDGERRDATLHETRKAAKRLRYAVEVARPSMGRPAKRLSRRLKKLHKALGAHQDAVVARPLIRQLASQAHLEGGNGFTYGLLHAEETARAAAAERSLPAAWKPLRKHF
ncbi:MAG: CYTH and CHAD domain-containing protein [Actinomycetota bacterium]|nr:CYTH and CHAD domain-containing protein [Actinomycetota bacterium]